MDFNPHLEASTPKVMKGKKKISARPTSKTIVIKLGLFTPCRNYRTSTN
jgi:hypothetical protein